MHSSGTHIISSSPEQPCTTKMNFVFYNQMNVVWMLVKSINNSITCNSSYVYWTVHHLDSWIKIDQLDVTCFIISLFTAQHDSKVSTSIFRSLRLIVNLFRALYCSGTMCVGVMVWFGWGGVVSLCRLKQYCFVSFFTTTPVLYILPLVTTWVATYGPVSY